MLFVGPGGTGRDVWQTDGTPLNYSRVPGFAPLAQAGGKAQNLFAVGGSVFFTEKPYNSSPRLWRVGVEPVVLDEDGVLSVNGTDPAEADPAHPAGADQIGLTAAGDTLTVTVNGAAHAFAAAGVRHVTVNGLGGDDTLTVEGIPAAQLTFNGGEEDTLAVRGTGGDDRVVSATPRTSARPAPSTPGVETVSIDLLGGDDAVTVLGPDGARDPRRRGQRQGRGRRPRPGLELEYAVSDAGVGRSSNGGPVAPVSTFDGFEDVTLRAALGEPDRRDAQRHRATWRSTARRAAGGRRAGRDRLRRWTPPAPPARRRTPGAVAGSGEWTFADRRPISYANVEQTDDGVPLTASINLTPNPRRQPVAEVAIVFSEPVSGIDPSDLRLTRGNDPQNLLTRAQTLTTGDGGTTWVLGGLAGPTAADGRYLLALPAWGTGVVDAVGIPLSDDLSYAITVDTVGPTADVVDVAPDPANRPCRGSTFPQRAGEGPGGVGPDVEPQRRAEPADQRAESRAD